MKVAFYKGTRPGIEGLFNIGVRWWEKGPYSHTEAILEEYSDGTVLGASSSFIDGGVRMKVITLDPQNWDVVDVPGVDVASVRAWFEAHKGLPYDLRGLVGFIIGPVPAEKNKYFCDEAVATAMGIEEAWRFDPNGFYQICRRLAAVTPVFSPAFSPVPA